MRREAAMSMRANAFHERVLMQSLRATPATCRDRSASGRISRDTGICRIPSKQEPLARFFFGSFRTVTPDDVNHP